MRCLVKSCYGSAQDIVQTKRHRSGTGSKSLEAFILDSNPFAVKHTNSDASNRGRVSAECVTRP